MSRWIRGYTICLNEGVKFVLQCEKCGCSLMLEDVEVVADMSRTWPDNVPMLCTACEAEIPGFMQYSTELWIAQPVTPNEAQ